MMNVMSLLRLNALAGFTPGPPAMQRSVTGADEVAPFVVQNKAAYDVTAGRFHRPQHLLSILTRTAGSGALAAAAAHR